jgi:hypothetical protein
MLTYADVCCSVLMVATQPHISTHTLTHTRTHTHAHKHTDICTQTHTHTHTYAHTHTHTHTHTRTLLTALEQNLLVCVDHTHTARLDLPVQREPLAVP